MLAVALFTGEGAVPFLEARTELIQSEAGPHDLRRSLGYEILLVGKPRSNEGGHWSLGLEESLLTSGDDFAFLEHPGVRGRK